MFEETTLLGFDMASQRNRRIAVCVTYGVILALAIVPLLLFRRFPVSISFCVNVQLLLILIVGRSIFGGMVPPSVWLTRTPKSQTQTSLGIATTVASGERVPDEREVAVRNRAFFSAYNTMVIVACFVINVAIICIDRHTALAETCGFELMLLFMIALFTLPQAVVIWTEPDLPAQEFA